MSQEDDYKILLKHFIDVTRSLKGQIVEEEWMIYTEGVTLKLFGHISSIFSLFQGTRWLYGANLFLDFIDHGSIKVLTRAALETGLAFHLIFCESADNEEKRFRFMCWDYAGFIDRQGLHTSSEEGRELKGSEAIQMEEVKQKIIGHSSFARFSERQQKRILEAEWRLGQSWTAIGVSAGYSKEYFKSTYSYLCAYAHTGRLSVLQVLQAKERETQRQIAEVCIGYGCIIMSNFLFGYRSLYLLTGLIKCVYCKFNYQGSRHKPTGNSYYVDGGYINKGKSVCKWHSVRQDVLESFVIKSIKDLLLTPAMIDRIEHELRELCNNGPESVETKLNLVDLRARETDVKIHNLVLLAEKGTNLDSIAKRISALEGEKQALTIERNEVIANKVRRTSRQNASSAVSRFLHNFERSLDQAPIAEKKELIRMVVEKIDVDREAGKVNCYVRRLPKIKEIEKMEEETTFLLGRASSANGNLLHPVSESRVTELILQ